MKDFSDPTAHLERTILAVIRAFFVCSVAVCCLLSFVSSTSALTFEVNDLGDQGDATPGDTFCATSGGTCTLRAAIEEINATDASSNTVTFSPGLSLPGTILLGSSLPTIASSISIVGPGSDLLTIDGQGSVEILQINLTAYGTVYMSGLRFTGGTSTAAGALYISSTAFATFEETVFAANNATGSMGGAIYCSGCTLWLRKNRFSSNLAANSGGAVYASVATIDIRDSVFIENAAGQGGGAILATTSDVSIEDSRIESNSAGHGGGGLMIGVADGGRFICRDTVVSGNNGGSDRGGGIFLYGTGASSILQNVALSGNRAGDDGGGLYITSSPYTVIANSTFSGNSAGLYGGGISHGDSVTVKLSNVTITNNEAGTGLVAEAGGGLSGPFTIENSIIAGNTDLSSNNLDHAPDCFGNITSNGHNIIGDASWCTVAASEGDNFGNSTTPVDPIVGPLARNGGTTPTQALLSGSPAIDSGNAAGCKWDDNADGDAATPDQLLTDDQRSSPRPWDPFVTGTQICDAGAFEWTNCANGVKDGDETGIDCGGSCAACSCPSEDFAATNGTTYSSVQGAYDTTWDGAEIKAREADTSEVLTFDRPAYITLIGGHDCNFFRIKGMTTVSSLTVSAGLLTVGNVAIGP